LKTTPTAEMAARYVRELECDWVVFLETPQPFPPREGRDPIIFTNNREVIKVVPHAIFLNITTPEDDDELSDCLVWEASFRGLVPPGRTIIFSRFNGGVEDLLGKIKKVPEWMLVIREKAVAGTIGFAQHLSEKGVGAAFLVGDSRRVLKLSEDIYPLRLKGRIKIWERKYWEFFTRLAGTFDGAFVIESNGEVVAPCVRVKPRAEVGLEGLEGLGTRHRAVCAMTVDTKAVGVAVSEEDRRIRIFREGKKLYTIGPPKI
jgi:hypothetical protein